MKLIRKKMVSQRLVSPWQDKFDPVSWKHFNEVKPQHIWILLLVEHALTFLMGYQRFPKGANDFEGMFWVSGVLGGQR